MPTYSAFANTYGVTVVVDVPRSERRRRPMYIDGNMNSGTCRRNGEGDYH